MKQHIFSILSVMAFSMAMTPAMVHAAEDEYFVEVGDDVQKDDAQGQWNALVSKHKNLLGKLKLYPKDVVQNNGPMVTRLQAGPIASKTAALKICNKLFAADVACFVIEGVNDIPPTAMMHLNETSQMAASSGTLPWLAVKNTNTVAAAAVPAEKPAEELVDWAQNAPVARRVEAEPVKGNVVLPWLTEKQAAEDKAAAEKIAEDEANNEQADIEAANTKRKAQVQVAEAIRVPLTETNTLEDRIRVSALPELRPTFGAPTMKDESNEMGNVNSGAGWLNVGNFVNEEIASSMWEEVRSANKKQSKSLNMKVSEAKASASGDKATLSVGPFANSAEAYNFCRSGLQANERGLRCSFVANDTGIANNKVLALNAHADAYNERRRPRENPSAQLAEGGPAKLGNLSPASGPSKQYWVQVVSADSQLQALKKWEQVKAANSEVIGDLRSSVSTSSTDKSSYVVRVGPIAENDQAIRVCSQLQKRNVECRVLLYSRGSI